MLKEVDVSDNHVLDASANTISAKKQKTDFEWDGLCSHSPLLEPVHGDLDLDPEQLEAMTDECGPKEVRISASPVERHSPSRGGSESWNPKLSQTFPPLIVGSKSMCMVGFPQEWRQYGEDCHPCYRAQYLFESGDTARGKWIDKLWNLADPLG